MKTRKQISIGLKTYNQAFNFISKHKLWWIFLFPLLITLALFFGGNALIGDLIETLKAQISDLLNFENATFWGAQYLNYFLSGIIWVLFKILFFFIFAYFGGYIVIIILSPILAYLSEKTEKLHTNKDYPFDFKQFIIDIGRGITIAIRNAAIEILLTLAILIISFIPIIGWVIGILSPVILFFISAYFYGFSFMDYSMERKRLSVKNSSKFMRQYKALALSNGSIFALSLIIPYCGVLLSSFVAVVSVVAGTIAIDEVYKSEENHE